MGSAFQCDRCEYCEPGEPIVRFKVESTEVKTKSEEWCNECMSSFQEWYRSGEPVTDEVVEA